MKNKGNLVAWCKRGRVAFITDCATLDEVKAYMEVNNINTLYHNGRALTWRVSSNFGGHKYRRTRFTDGEWYLAKVGDRVEIVTALFADNLHGIKLLHSHGEKILKEYAIDGGYVYLLCSKLKDGQDIFRVFNSAGEFSQYGKDVQMWQKRFSPSTYSLAEAGQLFVDITAMNLMDEALGKMSEKSRQLYLLNKVRVSVNTDIVC